MDVEIVVRILEGSDLGQLASAWAIPISQQYELRDGKIPSSALVVQKGLHFGFDSMIDLSKLFGLTGSFHHVHQESTALEIHELV